jgi:hypothetical protein
MRVATLIAFCKSRRWAHGNSARRPGFVSCCSGFSLVRGGKGENKRFERNRTHSHRRLKMCFPRPKPEQRALRTPSDGCHHQAGVGRWCGDGAANMGACWERATAWSVCCATRSRPDAVVVLSFDRFHFRGGKGAEERIWSGGREGGAHMWTMPAEIPFPRPEVDLRRTL